MVGTTTGGSGEFLTNRVTGLTWNAGEPRSLAIALRELQNDPALGQRMATTAQNMVCERFNHQVMIDAIADVLVRVANQATARFTKGTTSIKPTPFGTPAASTVSRSA